MKSSLSLFLFLYLGVCVTAKSPQQIDKFSYIMNSLTRPYSNAISNMRTKTDSSYRKFQDMISGGLASELLEDEPFSSPNEKYQRTIKAKAKIDNQENLPINEEIEDSSRMLAGSCSSVSMAVNTQVNVYTCSGIEVSKADYETRNGVGCIVTSTTKNLCYCPYDYYGDNCQARNTFTCEIERVSHPLNCLGTDNFNYVYSFSGIPPCYQVQPGTNVIFKTKLICSSTNSQYDFEGVKPSKYEVIQQPTVSTSFTYAISNDRFRVTNLNSSAITQQISFTNWKRMTNPIVLTTYLTQEQIAGTSEIVTNINFQDTNLAQSATSGRYYFELSIKSDRPPNFSTQDYNGGFFEQAGYQEPAPAKKSSRVLVIVLPILGAILLIGLIIGYKVYQRRKEQLEQRLTAESAPLVQDE